MLLTLAGFTGSLVKLPWQALAGGLYIGFFEMGLSFIFWLRAMKLTENTARISTLIFLSPPLSLILIWALLDEAIKGSTLVGLAMILAGLAMQHWQRPHDPSV